MKSENGDYEIVKDRKKKYVYIQIQKKNSVECINQLCMRSNLMKYYMPFYSGHNSS